MIVNSDYDVQAGQYIFVRYKYDKDLRKHINVRYIQGALDILDDGDIRGSLMMTLSYHIYKVQKRIMKSMYLYLTHIYVLLHFLKK